MRTLLAGWIAIACAAAPTLAQDEPVQPTDPADAAPANGDDYPSLDLTLTPAGEFTFEADLKDSPGDVSVARTGGNLTLNIAATEQLRLGLSADAEASWYDFGGATTLIAGAPDPFNDMYLLRVSPSVMYHFSQQWAVLAGGLFEVAGEPDADIGDSFTGGGFAGVRHAFSETFAFTLGVVAKSSLEDDAFIFPLIGVEWQITPKVSLSSAGPGARLTAELSDHLAFFIQAGYQQREYRLADDSPLPSGVVRDRRIPVAVGLTWTPTPAISLTLRGGATVWQEFQVDSSAGVQVSEVNTQPAPFIGLSADFRF